MSWFGILDCVEELFLDNLRKSGVAIVLVILAVIIWHISKSYRRRTEQISEGRSTLEAKINSSTGVSELVSVADLRCLIKDLEGDIDNTEAWDPIIEKRSNLMSYKAKCHKEKDGSLKYFSIAIFEHCTTEKLRDFYMDNEYRKSWDKTIISHEQLQVDEISGIEVGRTVKKFLFLAPREYVLAWRLWEDEKKTFYCFIKECEHPMASRGKKLVRVEFFRSGWRIRKVPGREACEVMMVHQEDAKLNVEMAKLAFSKGIWNYMCKMDRALRTYRQSSTPVFSVAKKVPPEIQADTLAQSWNQRESKITLRSREKIRPSKKLVANSLLLLCGVACLSRGQTSLIAKVAMACILKKLNKPKSRT